MKKIIFTALIALLTLGGNHAAARDLYKDRAHHETPLIVAEAGESFHGVRVGDTKAQTERKLGGDFAAAYVSAYRGGIGIYLDNEITDHFLYIAFDENDRAVVLSWQQNRVYQLHER